MRDGIEQGGFQPLALSFRFRLPELFHRSRAFDRDGDHGADRIHGLTRKQRSEEHTSELQSQSNLVCRLLLEKKKKNTRSHSLSLNPNIHAISLIKSLVSVF